MCNHVFRTIQGEPETNYYVRQAFNNFFHGFLEHAPRLISLKHQV